MNAINESQLLKGPTRTRTELINKRLSELYKNFSREEIGYCLLKQELKLIDRPMESQEILKIANDIKEVRLSDEEAQPRAEGEDQGG